MFLPAFHMVEPQPTLFRHRGQGSHTWGRWRSSWLKRSRVCKLPRKSLRTWWLAQQACRRERRSELGTRAAGRLSVQQELWRLKRNKAFLHQVPERIRQADKNGPSTASTKERDTLCFVSQILCRKTDHHKGSMAGQAVLGALLDIACKALTHAEALAFAVSRHDPTCPVSSAFLPSTPSTIHPVGTFMVNTNTANVCY